MEGFGVIKKYPLVLCILILFNIVVYSDDNILTVYYFDRMPYYGTENNEPKGIIVEISKLIFDEAGIKYKFEDLPSMRILERMKNNGNMASLGWLKNTEREKIYSFTSEPVYQDEPYCVLANSSISDKFKNNNSIEEILTNKMILGVVTGFAYGEWLNGKIIKYKPKKQEVNIGDDADKMYQMLSINRFNYMFAGFEESLYVISRNSDYKKNIVIIPISDARFGNQRYIMFNKDIDQNMLRKINGAVEKIKHDDRYKKIIARLRSGMY